MTPAARIAAAIEIVDAIAAGLAAEQALIRWSRQSRFAGSKDRAAVRDHVFDVLRRRDSLACLGGGKDGRALLAGLLRAEGHDPHAFFTGEGHAPAPLTPSETEAFGEAAICDGHWNMPEWIAEEFTASLGERAAEAAKALQTRAPVTLRVNMARTSRGAAQADLLTEGVTCVENPLCDTALTVTAGARQLRQTSIYLDGRIELQDAASQAVVAALPPGRFCLDYCAGGGGKALALAAQADRQVFAHDSDPRRMTDLAARAARAGARIQQLEGADCVKRAPYDLVLCDVPCSGSGAWRRSPEAKWAFLREDLLRLCAVQDEILNTCAPMVGAGGTLAYATCSLLKAENEDRIAAFLARSPDWSCSLQRRFHVSPEGDGFYTAHLTRLA